MSRKQFIGKILTAFLAIFLGQSAALEAVSRMGYGPSYESFAYPLMRKIYPQLDAKSLVSVQPMSTPSSLTFFMDYRSPTELRNDYCDKEYWL